MLSDRSTAQLLNDRLALKLTAQNALTQLEDQLELVLPVSRQKLGLVGTYKLLRNLILP